MKFLFRRLQVLLALSLLASAASANPIPWVLQGVTLSDGGTANGTFTFNPDGGTPCGSVSPCGSYSNVDIVTTSGSERTGVSYLFVCGQDVPGCTGVIPNSTEVLFLASNTTNQSGAPAIAFFFTGISGLPPQGLTDAGGVIDISNASGSVGTVQEADCPDAACSSPSGTTRFSTAGTASSTPEPATWLLLAAGFGVIGALRLRRKVDQRRASSSSTISERSCSRSSTASRPSGERSNSRMSKSAGSLVNCRSAPV